MPTLFAQMETAVSAAVDHLHMERTRLVPRAPGEFIRGGQDPTRVVREVMGVIDFNPVTIRAREQSEYDGYRPELDGEKVHVSYTASRLGAFTPRKDDLIEALDRPGVPKFQIITAEPDGLGRVLCRCVPAS